MVRAKFRILATSAMYFYPWVLFVLLLTSTSARPWSPESEANSIEVVNQVSSPLMTTIDSISSSFARSLKQYSPSLTPLLSVATMGYVGYIASVMFMPSVLSDAGIPLLKDFTFETRARTTESGFIDSLATGILKDMIRRTEAADVLSNTSMNAISDGMKTFKKTTRVVNSGLKSARGIVGRVLTALTPECITRYMCQAGQFTSLHMPAIGPVLRSINTFDLDDYSQALIDGTTIGDCSAVFFQCPL